MCILSPQKECGVLWFGFLSPFPSTLRMPAKGVRMCVGGWDGEFQRCMSFPSGFIKDVKAQNM